ncbi:hypothetical protein ACN47E_002195 [Coniothyrium glycines]
MFPKSFVPRIPNLSHCLIAVLSVGLVLNLGTFVFSLRILARGKREYTYLSGDRPRELPIKVRTIQAVFQDDPSHYALEGIPAWAEWNAIRPPGSGYAFLGEEHFAFGVSMWHQIHCLNHIRTMLIHGDDGSNHTEHCFHYLRQGILCAADTTIEPGGVAMRKENGEASHPVVRAVHTCRDWRQVHDWLESEHENWTPEMSERLHEVS